MNNFPSFSMDDGPVYSISFIMSPRLRTACFVAMHSEKPISIGSFDGSCVACATCSIPMEEERHLSSLVFLDI